MGTWHRTSLNTGGGLNADVVRVGSERMPSVVRGVSRIGTFEGADGNVTPERDGRYPSNLVFRNDVLSKSSMTHPLRKYFHSVTGLK